MKTNRYFIIVLILALCSLNSFAKTTYIPRYFATMTINGSQCVMNDSSITRELTMFADDGRYSITVMQDSVTKERIKAIKRNKAAAGWAGVSAALSGISATLQPLNTGADAVRYMSEIESMKSSIGYSIMASSTANNLQKVPVTILIENMTDDEMVVNDLRRGLTWYVIPHSFTTLTVGNPEINQLRIAYSNCSNQKIDYVKIKAGNYLRKDDIIYEDGDVWIIPVYETQYNDLSSTYSSSIKEYKVINKTTFIETKMDYKEYKQYKKEHQD